MHMYQLKLSYCGFVLYECVARCRCGEATDMARDAGSYWSRWSVRHQRRVTWLQHHAVWRLVWWRLVVFRSKQHGLLPVLGEHLTVYVLQTTDEHSKQCKPRVVCMYVHVHLNPKLCTQDSIKVFALSTDRQLGGGDCRCCELPERSVHVRTHEDSVFATGGRSRLRSTLGCAKHV